jgi:hypothetical protein
VVGYAQRGRAGGYQRDRPIADRARTRPALSLLVWRRRLEAQPHARAARADWRQAIRIFYAFNPTRTAILLIGGNKTGDKRFYKKMIPIADRLYDEHIAELKREGLIP